MQNHLNAGICKITLLTKAFLLTNQFSPNSETSMMLSKNVTDLANPNVVPSITRTPVAEQIEDGINWDHNSKQPIPDGQVIEFILDQKTTILANHAAAISLIKWHLKKFLIKLIQIYHRWTFCYFPDLSNISRMKVFQTALKWDSIKLWRPLWHHPKWKF